MPLRVAVAGISSSGLGCAIASALLDAPDLEVVVLTRSSSATTADVTNFISRGAIVKSVDYSSVPSLTSALDGVDTVICSVFAAEPSISLIQASKAAGVRRFAPSDFAFSKTANDKLALYEPKRQTQAALEESGLEYTLFQNGIFMDYFAFGAPKPHEGPLRVFPLIVNIVTQKAIIPGTGKEEVTFTSLRDIGQFVAAAVKLETRWPKELGMVGETKTYNQVVKDIEEITGRKLEVEYLDKERLAMALEETKGERYKYFLNQCYEVYADGLGSVEPTLNQLFPRVKVTSVREFLEEYWKV